MLKEQKGELLEPEFRKYTVQQGVDNSLALGAEYAEKYAVRFEKFIVKSNLIYCDAVRNK